MPALPMPLEAAIRAARAAGEVILPYFGSIR